MIMSIGRLLAAGKSLVGVQNASSRYRMDKRARLPKFGVAKNPFTAEPRIPAAPRPVPPQPPAASADLAARATPSPLHLAGIAATTLIAMSFLMSSAGGSFIYRAF